MQPAFSELNRVESMLCIWFCDTENTVADIQWTLKLWLTTCLRLYSTQRDFSPLKTHCVWSHKRILNKSTLFHVCTVEMFQRHQALSQSIHRWSYSLIMCSSPSQTDDDRLRVRDHSVFTDWTSLKCRRLHRTGITEPFSIHPPQPPPPFSFILSHLTDQTVPMPEIKYKRKK